MQKVTLIFKSVNVEETAKQKKAVFDTVEKTHIVASTKSFNNLKDKYNTDGQPVSSAKAENLFLDRTATEKAVDTLVSEQIKDKATADMVAEYVKGVLDGGCVYYKPIIRKK